MRLRTTPVGWFAPAIATIALGIALVAAYELLPHGWGAGDIVTGLSLLFGPTAVLVFAIVGFSGEDVKSHRIARLLALLALLGVLRAMHAAWDDPHEMLAIIVSGFVGLCALLAAAGGPDYLAIDVPAGSVELTHLAKKKRVDVAELGELAVREKIDEGPNNSRTVTFVLVAHGFGDAALFRASDRGAVEARRVLVEQLVTRALLRRVLAAAPAASEQGAFREGPSTLYLARQAVADDVRLRQGLETLTADRDSHVSARAVELLAALAREAAEAAATA